MKILLVTSHSPFFELTGPIAAGAEIAMRRIAEKMAARGHEVHYLTFDESATASEYVINKVYIHLLNREHAKRKTGSLLLRVLSVLGWKICLWTPQNLPIVGKYIRKWLSHLQVRMERLDNLLWGFKSHIDQIVTKHNIDLIHTFSSMPDSLAGAMVANKRNIPLVLRMGGRYWYLKYQKLKGGGKRENYLRDLEYVFSNTACLAFNAKALRRQTLKFMFEHNLPISDSHPIIDIGIETPKEIKESYIPPDLLAPTDIIISCVGKFKDNSKRQDLIIKALSSLPEEVKAFFAGDGSNLEKMRELAEERGVADRTFFLGAISHDLIFSLLDRSDIFVHPTEFEGSSKAVAEAMLLGKPIIGSNIPALAEHIKHGQNGLLAENEEESFRESLQLLISEPEKRRRIGEAGREYALKNFCAEENVLLYEELFQKVISQRKASYQTSTGLLVDTEESSGVMIENVN